MAGIPSSAGFPAVSLSDCQLDTQWLLLDCNDNGSEEEGEEEEEEEEKRSVGCSGPRLDYDSITDRPALTTAQDDEDPANRVGVGLRNMSNTCFLNSVLQCLTHTKPLVDYVENHPHMSSCPVEGFCALCSFGRHVKATLSSDKAFYPAELVENMKCICKSFSPFEQQDAHEYFVCFIEALSICITTGNPEKLSVPIDESFLSRMFMGQFRNQLKCLQCLRCSVKCEPFFAGFSLEIFDCNTLQEALSCFTAVETLNEEGGARCEQCQEQGRTQISSRSRTKQLTIEEAPVVITAQLKRFSALNYLSKIDTEVNFELRLDLKPFMSNGQTYKENEFIYSLYAVLVHLGSSIQMGHYVSYVRTSSNIWHCFNDSSVTRVSEKTVLEQKAYILFYLREGSDLQKETISSGPSLQVQPKDKCNSMRPVTETQANWPSPCVMGTTKDGHMGQAKQIAPKQLTQPKQACVTNRLNLDGFWKVSAVGAAVPTSQQEAAISRIPMELDYDRKKSTNKVSSATHSNLHGGTPGKVLASERQSVSIEYSSSSDVSSEGKCTPLSSRKRSVLSNNSGKKSHLDPCNRFESGTAQSYNRILSSMPASRRALIASALPTQKPAGVGEEGQSKTRKKITTISPDQAKQPCKKHCLLDAKEAARQPNNVHKEKVLLNKALTDQSLREVNVKGVKQRRSFNKVDADLVMKDPGVSNGQFPFCTGLKESVEWQSNNTANENTIDCPTREADGNTHETATLRMKKSQEHEGLLCSESRDAEDKEEEEAALLVSVKKNPGRLKPQKDTSAPFVLEFENRPLTGSIHNYFEKSPTHTIDKLTLSR